jgi:hypothetical protein
MTAAALCVGAQGAHAQAADDPNAAATAQIERQQKEVALEQSNVDLEKAKIDLAAKKATAVSTAIPSSGMTPGATLGENGGQSEGYLLASRALRNAGAQIAKAVGTDTGVVIAPTTADLELGHWRAFRLRVALVKQQLDDANAWFKMEDDAAKKEAQAKKDAAAKKAKKGKKGKTARAEAPPPPPPPEAGGGVAPLLAVGDALSAAAKIGSFFGSSYELRGQTFTASEDMLAAAVAENFQFGAPSTAAPDPAPEAAPLCPGDTSVKVSFQKSVHILKLVNDPNAVRYFACSLQDLDKLYVKAVLNLSVATSEKLTGSAAQLTAAIQSYASFVTDLTSANGPAIEQIEQERILAAAARDGARVLVVQPFGMNGGVYSQTNLWTWLGTSLPYKASGSAVAGYRLTDTSGQLIRTGVVDSHSDYTAINKIPTAIKIP